METFAVSWDVVIHLIENYSVKVKTRSQLKQTKTPLSKDRAQENGSLSLSCHGKIGHLPVIVQKKEEKKDSNGFLVLTFLDEEEGERQHDRVATVQKVSTHEMGACDGQTSSRHQLQNSLDLAVRITVELQREAERS